MPYPQDGVPDGLAFSCSETKIPQPSLKVIMSAIEEQLAPGSFDLENIYDLKPLANAGVLLLNSALTVEVNNAGSHLEAWSKFIAEVLFKLQEQKKDLVYVLYGSHAHKFADIIVNYKKIYKNYHPAYINRNPLTPLGTDFKEIKELTGIDFVKVLRT